MKKQHLKRFAYGFSALVLGVSVVEIFPAGAYAELVEESVVTEESTNLSTEPVNTDGNSDANVSSGNISTDHVLADNDVSTENILTSNVSTENIPTNNVSADDEFIDGDISSNTTILASGDEDGDADKYINGDEDNNENNVRRIVNDNYERVQKVVNLEEPFTVQAIKGAHITIIDRSSDYWLLSAEDDEEPAGPKFATEDQITVEETAPGEYTVTPLQAGRFMITLQNFVMKDDILTNQQLDIYLTVVATGTEAAKTITNIMNSYAGAGTIADKAYREFLEVYHDENATEEEKNAAAAEYQRKTTEAYAGVEQKEINTFGDDSMAIWEAAETGKELTTQIVVETLTESEVDEAVKSALLDNLDITFSGNIKYYNVDVKVYADGEEIGTLKELIGKETIVIDGFASAPAGYKRVFKVLGYHKYLDENFEEQIEIIEIDNVTFDETTGSIMFLADKFPTYLVAYKDVFAPSVNTGAATDTEGVSATTSASLSVITIVIIITLAGAVKISKIRK